MEKRAWLFIGILVAGCPAKTTPSPAPAAAVAADAGRPRAAASGSLLTPVAAPGPVERPPHPAMATSNYGLAAIQAMAGVVAASTGPVTIAAGLSRLASVDDNAISEARTLFLQAYRAATTDDVRGDAVAGVMLALIMDRDPVGYTERLTDAYGMQLYAAAIGGKSSVVGPARVLVQAAAGRIAETVATTKRIADANPPDAWIRTLEGMARATILDRSGALTAFAAALKVGQAMPRTLLERADVYFRVGDLASCRADAEAALKTSPACTRCRLLRAQALALSPEAAASSEGLAELSKLSSEKIPAYFLSDALATAAVVEARGHHADAAAALAQRLVALKTAAPEAALTDGLAAAERGDHAAAVLALDRAARTLNAGPLRAAALRGLVDSALGEKQNARAAEALRGLEAETGQTLETALAGERVAQALQDKGSVDNERLRAFALDPYSDERARAVGRKAFPGGADASRKAAQMWRLIGGGAASDAIAIARDLAGRDRNNPYPAWVMVLCQRQLDLATAVGSVPGKDVILHALDAVKRLGKRAPHEVFHPAARKDLILALDEGERDAVREALKRFVGDPDPGVAPMAKEAAQRPGARPRATAHDTHEPEH